MNPLVRCASLAFLFLLVNCATMHETSSHSLTPAQERLRVSRQPAVLFVGNSFSEGVPEEFLRIASRQGVPVRADRATTGGWTLARHAKCPDTLHKIRQGQWDVVILQEQSQMPARSAWARRLKMRPALVKLADEVRSAGAVPLLMQTWGYRHGDSAHAHDDFHKMTARLRTGTHEEAARAQVPVVPVGDAWQHQVEQGRADTLFHTDGWHPSRTGNQTTALTVFNVLFPSR